MYDVNQYLLQRKTEFNREVGEKLKEKRHEKKISLNDLSCMSHTSPTYISQLERGDYTMSLFKFITICNALDIDVNEFLEDFVVGGKKNEDILYSTLQNGKNIAYNILDFMKQKE